LEAKGAECARLGSQVRQLFSEKRFTDALTMAENRLELSKSAYGIEHAMTATCLNDVATFEQFFQRYERAEELFEQASRIQRKLLGDCHPHSLATLQNLAALYESKGDVVKGEAMRMLVQATRRGAVQP
jgi:tetratricopeptide (TPR) repeat protein|tara:strand:- start:931 stop:1317 length:387 start_codon:yes stop_codon:yes gene_type:complete